MPETMTFTKACREYFGLRPGTKLIDYAAELKALTEQDRTEMAPLLAEALGVDEVTVAPRS